MTNYQKSKIYKIESHLGDKIYIGATCKDYLSQRFQAHKHDYRRWKNGKARKVNSYEIFDLYGIDNCSIVLLEACPCDSKDEQNAKESFYIRTMDCVNKVIPDRKKEEYNKAYVNSEEGRATRKAYEDSETCKAMRKCYHQSEAGKAKAKAYKESDICKAKAKANYQRKKALKEATNTAQDPI
jgi:hypothetical protein